MGAQCPHADRDSTNNNGHRPQPRGDSGGARNSTNTMKAEIKGNQLVITIDMQEPAPSATGKTLVVASTHGNQASTAVVKGKPVVIGLNAYIKP